MPDVNFTANTIDPTATAASYNAANTAPSSSDSTITQNKKAPTALLSVDTPVHSNSLTGKTTAAATTTSGSGTTGTTPPPTSGTGTTGGGSGTGTTGGTGTTSTSSTSTAAPTTDEATLEREQQQKAEEEVADMDIAGENKQTQTANPNIKNEGRYNVIAA